MIALLLLCCVTVPAASELSLSVWTTAHINCHHKRSTLEGSNLDCQRLVVYTAIAGISGYTTDLSEHNIVSGLSPLPFVSPSHGLGPQMHPRLPDPTSLASSQGYPAHLYSSPAGHTALPLQQQQHRYLHPTGAHKHSSSSAMPWLSSSVEADAEARGNPEATQNSQAGLYQAQHAQRRAEGNNPHAMRDSQARSFEAQHAQHSTEEQTCLEEETGFYRRASASVNHIGGEVRAAFQASGHDAAAVVDPVPALQTNLTAMNAAIGRAADAVMPGQSAVSHPVPAASSSHIKLAADPASKPAVSLPVQAAVVTKQILPPEAQAIDARPADSAPASSPPQQQQPVSQSAGSFPPSAHQQTGSMAPASVAPNLAQQPVSLPPGNLAPIGPPAMRAMTSHGPGTLLQLAAPALLPLQPIVDSAPHSSATHTASTAAAAAAVLPISMTAAARAEPASSGVVVTWDVARVQSDASRESEALAEALKPEVSKDTITRPTQQGLLFNSVDVSGQQAGQKAEQQVSVSSASAVMLDEARAAGTARQAALAVLNDTVQPAPASRQPEAQHSLPDQPFGSAQSNLATAVGTSRQLFSDAEAPTATAVGLAPAARPQAIATMASMGQPQSLMTMTGPLPETGKGQEADSPVGGRPSQSETAVTVGKGSGIVTAPQDLHAAHLVHVLHAHKVSQQLSDSQAQEDGVEARQQPEWALSGGASLPRIPEHSDAEAPVAGECQQFALTTCSS